MKVANLSYEDMAGVGYFLCKLINEKTDHTCRQISIPRTTFKGHPIDIHLHNTSLVRKTLDDADIIHVNSPDINLEKTLYGHVKFPDITRYIGKKKIIAHYHGGEIKAQRNNADKHFIKFENLGIQAFVSTPELKSIHPYLKWLPSPVNLDLLPLPVSERNKKLTLFHATIDKRRKNAKFMWNLLVERGLHPKYYNYSPTYGIYHYNELIRRMSKAHILFNHFYPFYGVVSIEAAMLGLVVLTNMSNIVRIYTCNCPFIHVTKENIKETLLRLKDKSKDELLKIGLTHREFVYKQHCYDLLKIIKEAYK
jgi:hypothetical protein